MVYRRYELVARSNDLFGPLRIEIPGALSRRVELLLQPLAAFRSVIEFLGPVIQHLICRIEAAELGRPDKNPSPSAAHLRHQSQHAIQADSTGEIPAGKDNLCAGL